MKLFKAFRLDTANHLLWRDGERVPLAPKAFDVLAYLVEHAGRLVTQDEILGRYGLRLMSIRRSSESTFLRSGRPWATGPATRSLLKQCQSGGTGLLLLCWRRARPRHRLRRCQVRQKNFRHERTLEGERRFRERRGLPVNTGFGSLRSYQF